MRRYRLQVDGVVWFSWEVNIPDIWKGESLTLPLGIINDYDITWYLMAYILFDYIIRR